MSLVSRADEIQFFYAPNPTALTGVIREATGKNDSWTLRLPAPVTVNPNLAREGEILETDVKEVRLSGDGELIRAAAAAKSSVTCYGTLSRAPDPKDSLQMVMEIGADALCHRRCARQRRAAHLAGCPQVAG